MNEKGQKVVDPNMPPRGPINYRKNPPPGPLGRNEVIDIFGRWHMLAQTKPVTRFRRFRAKLGLREPLDMVAGDINLPLGAVIMCDGDESLDQRIERVRLGWKPHQG